MTPNPCKIGSPEWLAEIRAQYRTDEEIDSWYQPKEPDGYARRVVSDLVRMIDALAAERDAALSLEELPLSEWPADARDKRHAIEMADAVATARADIYDQLSRERDVESAAHLTTGDDRDRLRIEVERLTRERDDGRNEIADVPAAIAALREFVADPNVRTGAPVAEWTEREARLRRAIEREARAVRADRDRLAAALAGVLAAARACVDAFDDIGVPRAECSARNEALRVVLAATPTDLATARDARVRAEAYADGVQAGRATMAREAAPRALREAAERAGVKGASWTRGAFRRALQMWLRAEAERIERGGR